jgi:hypothetical protein
MEKFINSNVSYLRDANFDFIIFKKRITKTYEILKKIESIRLDSAYPSALEKYANEIINTLNYEEIEDVEELREYLLKQANLLQKEKNKTRYKKNKHKNATFNDGY